MRGDTVQLQHGNCPATVHQYIALPLLLSPGPPVHTAGIIVCLCCHVDRALLRIHCKLRQLTRPPPTLHPRCGAVGSLDEGVRGLFGGMALRMGMEQYFQHTKGNAMLADAAFPSLTNEEWVSCNHTQWGLGSSLNPLQVSLLQHQSHQI